MLRTNSKLTLSFVTVDITEIPQSRSSNLSVTLFFVKIYFKLIAVIYWLLSPLPLCSVWSPRSRACPVMWTCGTSLQWQQHNTQSSSGIDKVKQLLFVVKACCLSGSERITHSTVTQLTGFVVWSLLVESWSPSNISNSMLLAKFLANHLSHTSGKKRRTPKNSIEGSNSF